MSARDEQALTSCPDEDTSCPTCDSLWEEQHAAPDEDTAARVRAEIERRAAQRAAAGGAV